MSLEEKTSLKSLSLEIIQGVMKHTSKPSLPSTRTSYENFITLCTPSLYTYAFLSLLVYKLTSG